MTNWWEFPTDSPGGGYGQILDPVCANGSCNYLKPDTNIRIPAGTPITALLPGIITDVSSRGSGNGGLSVTEQLNNPINSLAKYMSFNFLGHSSVSIGQNISPGQQIGTAGSPTGINFALGLGPSPSWGSGSFPQGTGNPATNPMQVINAALSNSLGNIQPIQGTSQSGSSGGTSCAPWDIPCSISQMVTSDLFQRGSIIFIGLILALVGLVVVLIGEGAKHPEAVGTAAKVAAV